MHTITKEWINSNRTTKGSFTKVQIKALGQMWTQKKGWINRLVGREISEDSKLSFEIGRNKFNSGGMKNPIDEAILLIMKNVRSISDEKRFTLINALVETKKSTNTALKA